MSDSQRLTSEAATLVDANQGARAGQANRPAHDLAPGTRVRDYVVEGVLKAGGFATVYRARDARHGRPVALKILHPELAMAQEVLLRFEREVRILDLLHHPNVAEIYDFGTMEGGLPFIAMELLEGSDLASHLRASGRLSCTEALLIIDPVCDALAAAHVKGVIHRDVKASNVFLSEQDGRRRVMLLDFGVAKLEQPGETNLTTSRHAIGTPSSMSPEQIAGLTVDARSDVYGLGALAFHMLTGQLPFSGENVTVLQHMHMHGARPRPSGLANVPVAVDHVIVRALSVRPEQRFPGALEFLNAFREAVPGAATASAEPGAAGAEHAALGVHVEIRVPAGSLEDPDDALIEEIESALRRTVERFTGLGFVAGLEAGHAALLVRPLPTEASAERRMRHEAFREALDCLAEGQNGAPEAHRVRLRLCLHLAPAILAGGALRGGELAQLAWVPDGDLDGVLSTPAAAEGLEMPTEPLPDGAGLLRIRPPGPC